MAKKAPFVAVRTDIRKEERVLVVAEIGGYNRYEAMGRLLDLWAWCTDRGLQDAPADCPGYAVSEAVVCRFLGQHGVRAILGDNCDEFALGERRADGLVFLRGTTETVSRLRALQTSSSAGGEARSRQAQGKRSRGRFVGKTTKPPAVHQPIASRPPAPTDQDTSDPPATTSEIPDPQANSQIHKPEEKTELLLTPQTAQQPPPQSQYKRVVDDFDRRYTERYGTRPTWGGKQGALVKQLLAQHDAGEVIRRNEILFTAPPAFLADASVDIATLVQHFDKLAKPSQQRTLFAAQRARDPTVGRAEPRHPSEYASGDQEL